MGNITHLSQGELIQELKKCVQQSTIKPTPHPLLDECNRRKIKVTFKTIMLVNGSALDMEK